MSYSRVTVTSVAVLAGILALSSVSFAKDQPEPARGPKANAPIATMTEREQEDVDEQENDTATSTEEDRSDVRRSEVAKQVQALLTVANRNGGIGQEVRAIAQEYASTSDRIIETKSKVEDRPTWVSVLIGADYKNLGALRSEVVTTQNHIKRLTAARDRSTSSTTQATLDTQIQALKDTASSTETFVKENEDSFSFLGWFFKLFQR